MTPDIFNQAATEPSQIGLWSLGIGLLIVFLAMNIKLEIKIQNNEEEDSI
tara:strand:+ start:3449 stop:3598 length:150 start_codon:yes stop_codon:yes gene_type:complete